jgi:hypothetical protein
MDPDPMRQSIAKTGQRREKWISIGILVLGKEWGSPFKPVYPSFFRAIQSKSLAAYGPT